MEGTRSVLRNPLPESAYQGRLLPYEEDVRGPYFRDQTAIIHSMPFRRLKHKAQVFFSPKNDHVCTRIEHALHVATIAATIARGLGLNTELAYAIGLGHDLGHTPFGHAGETALKEKCADIGGFVHEAHGLRVVDVLGNRGVPLNLTFGVRDGIVCHCGESPDQRLAPRLTEVPLGSIKRDQLPASYEGCAARFADKIAYMGRDLEDAITGDFVRQEDIPLHVVDVLGDSNARIIDALVIDVVGTSQRVGELAFSDETFAALNELYRFSAERIYRHPRIQRYKNFCTRIINELFDYLLNIYSRWDSDFIQYANSPSPLDQRFGRYLQTMVPVFSRDRTGPKAIVRDYVAGMTDDYAIRCMKEISLPEDLSFDHAAKVQGPRA
jgi:dGTPase